MLATIWPVRYWLNFYIVINSELVIYGQWNEKGLLIRAIEEYQH